MTRRISIVTISFNSEATIRQTIESVLQQDCGGLEYIIIDGASSDRTMDIVREYGDRISIVVSEPDRGIYDAMNKGIQRATGDIIGFLNSDDFYAGSRSLGRLIDVMEENAADTAFADLVMVDRAHTDRIIRYYSSRNFHPERFRYGWMPAHPTFMVRRSLYQRHGGFRLNYRIAADFEMIVRLLHGTGATYAYLPEVIVKMRIGGISTASLSNIWRLNNEIVRACRANGLQTSLGRVLLKTPAKLLELLRRPQSAMQPEG